MIMCESENQDDRLLRDASAEEMCNSLFSRGFDAVVLSAKKATPEMQINREVSMLHSAQTSKEAAYGIILFWVKNRLENELFPSDDE